MKAATLHTTRAVAIAFALLMAHGCATIVRGSTEELTINSYPPGAKAVLSNGTVCETPCIVKVKRKGDITITFELPGYESQTVTSVSGISGGSLGVATTANLLTLPIINDVVDYNTGANYRHEPNPIHVELTPIEEGSE